MRAFGSNPRTEAEMPTVAMPWGIHQSSRFMGYFGKWEKNEDKIHIADGKNRPLCRRRVTAQTQMAHGSDDLMEEIRNSLDEGRDFHTIFCITCIRLLSP
jgi:hypothetical protein